MFNKKRYLIERNKHLQTVINSCEKELRNARFESNFLRRQNENMKTMLEGKEKEEYCNHDVEITKMLVNMIHAQPFDDIRTMYPYQFLKQNNYSDTDDIHSFFLSSRNSNKKYTIDEMLELKRKFRLSLEEREKLIKEKDKMSEEFRVRLEDEKKLTKAERVLRKKVVAENCELIEKARIMKPKTYQLIGETEFGTMSEGYIICDGARYVSENILKKTKQELAYTKNNLTVEKNDVAILENQLNQIKREYNSYKNDREANPAFKLIAERNKSIARIEKYKEIMLNKDEALQKKNSRFKEINKGLQTIIDNLSKNIDYNAEFDRITYNGDTINEIERVSNRIKSTNNGRKLL